MRHRGTSSGTMRGRGQILADVMRRCNLDTLSLANRGLTEVTKAALLLTSDLPIRMSSRTS